MRLALLRLTFVTAIALLTTQPLAAVKRSVVQKREQSELVIKKSVRRVIVDVVVTDSARKPVHGLTRKDFSVTENGKPQKILSFDVHDLDSVFTPPKLPPLPPNTFVNVPSAAERGPLYVLLLDLRNTFAEDQPFARQQLLKFLKDKPPGTRFALFVLSDTLRLVQGFTEDKDKLFAVADARNPHPHIPMIFLYGNNYNQGDGLSMIAVLARIAQYLDGLPGRKNLIWFSGSFPVQMFPSYDEPPDLQEDLKRVIDTLVQADVALDLIDVRGVVMEDSSFDYMDEDGIAEATGGHAFYSTNDLKGALLDATEIGGNYYTLTYAPSNKNYDGKRRKIHVALSIKGYQLAYRRSYYADEPGLPAPGSTKKEIAAQQAAPRKLGDSLFANMQHGAPMAHEIYFRAHIHLIGAPSMATTEQMANLADQPAYFRGRHKKRPLKPLVPVQLQTYAIDYTLVAQPSPGVLHNARPPALEIAAAAFNDDGQMLNGLVENSAPPNPQSAGTTNHTGIYRVEQRIEVPLTAISIRIAVRDTSTDRIGAMEIPLPLAPEPPTASIPTASSTGGSHSTETN